MQPRQAAWFERSKAVSKLRIHCNKRKAEKEREKSRSTSRGTKSKVLKLLVRRPPRTVSSGHQAEVRKCLVSTLAVSPRVRAPRIEQENRCIPLAPTPARSSKPAQHQHFSFYTFGFLSSSDVSGSEAAICRVCDQRSRCFIDKPFVVGTTKCSQRRRESVSSAHPAAAIDQGGQNQGWRRRSPHAAPAELLGRRFRPYRRRRWLPSSLFARRSTCTSRLSSSRGEAW